MATIGANETVELIKRVRISLCHLNHNIQRELDKRLLLRRAGLNGTVYGEANILENYASGSVGAKQVR